MVHSDLINRRLFIIFLLIVILFTSYLYCSSTANTSDFNFRVKKTKVTEYEDINNNGVSRISLYTQELMYYNNNELMDNIIKKLVFDVKKMMSVFLILNIILSFYQFCLYIRSWIIQILQTKTKSSFIVHYLQLKDGKKNALSFRFSF